MRKAHARWAESAIRDRLLDGLDGGKRLLRDLEGVGDVEVIFVESASLDSLREVSVELCKPTAPGHESVHAGTAHE